MERVVSVNAPNEDRRDAPINSFDPHPIAGGATAFPEIFGDSQQVEVPEELGDDSSVDPAGKWGTCLYFGPGGERCGRPAEASGFCSRHRGGAEAKAVRTTSPAKQNRILAAIFALLGILWSVLSPLLHAILHWLHSH